MAILDPVIDGSRRSRHRRRTTPYFLGSLVLVAWTTVFLTAPHVRTGASLHELALFAHLASLVLGFGAVLALDWFGLLWMLGRQDLLTLVRVAQASHIPIWIGLGGLTVSGALLSPDTSAPLTVVKLLAVLAVAINGLGAGRVQERLLTLEGQTLPRRLMITAVLTATVSQAGWWTATLVGFLNAQQ
jgi:hypothetical protein